jgi:hypothetical protein
MKSGYEYATEVDISNCFDSFQPQQVIELLPLPREVTTLTVLSHSFQLKPYSNNWLADGFESSDQLREYLEHMGVQWGIPQGSAISSLIAEVLLAPAIAQLPDCSLVVAYADNTLLMARSKDDVASMQKALLCALAAHPAGPLTPNKPKHYEPGDAVEFLGHQIAVENGAVRVSPSDENLHGFETKFKRNISDFLAHPDPHRLWELRRFIKSWSAAFRLWNEVGEHRSRYLKVVDDMKEHV